MDDGVHCRCGNCHGKKLQNDAAGCGSNCGAQRKAADGEAGDAKPVDAAAPAPAAAAPADAASAAEQPKQKVIHLRI